MPRQKVILINVPKPWLHEPKQQFPLGILYVAAVLEEKHDVEILDLADLTLEEIYDNAEGWLNHCYYTDYIGFSVTYPEYYFAERIGQHIKFINPNIKLILGGVHPTVAPDMVDHKLFDIIVLGEAEELFRMTKIDNLNGIVKTPSIDNLNIYPLPARHLLDRKSFISDTVFHHGISLKDGGGTAVMLSRGCPFGCTFCVSPINMGKDVRYYNTLRVSEELTQIIDIYGVQQFRFQDDNFTLLPSKILSILDILPLNIVWRCSTSVKLLNPPLLEHMYNAGCREIGIGIESADCSVLNKFNKLVDLSFARKAIRWIKDSGIWVRLFFMIGTPGETEHTVDLNIDFIEETQPDLVTFSLFAPYPGTSIWNSPEEYGIQILSKNPLDYLMNLSPDISIENTPNVLPVNVSYDTMVKNIRRTREYIFHKQDLGNRGL